MYTSHKVSKLSSSFYNSTAPYLTVPIIIIQISVLNFRSLYLSITTLVRVHIKHIQTSIRVYRAFPAIDEEKQWLTSRSALPSVLGEAGFTVCTTFPGPDYTDNVSVLNARLLTNSDRFLAYARFLLFVIHGHC